MSSDSTQSATLGDIRYLAELVTQNGNAIERIEERLGGMDERIGGMEERLVGMDERANGMNERISRMDERMEMGFSELKKMINGIGKHLLNHEERILALESAA